MAKTHLIFFLAVLLLLPMASSAQQLLDEDRGFMAYSLGMPPDSMDGIIRDGKSQKLIRWVPEKQDLVLEEISLHKVRLFFWQGRLHSIEIKTQMEASDNFLKWLENRYGEGSKEDAMGYRFYWEGEKVMLLFDQNLVTHDATTTFIDVEVHRDYYRYMYEREYGK